MKNKILNQIYTYALAVLFCLSIGIPTGIKAMEPVIERVYVQTDKQVYLTGENLWTKLYVTKQDGTISTFSKIVYLELLGDTIPYIQQKIDVYNGIADSRIHLPVNLPTGNYRLVAYTRSMRNEGEQVFFNKPVTIYNPFTSERIGNDKADLSPLKEENSTLSNSSSVISVDKQTYTTRAEGHVLLPDLGNETFSLSVSISRKEELPGASPVSINSWKQNIPKERQEKTASFLPEYEGHIVLGTVVSEDQSSNTIKKEIITPLIAFPGKGISLFTGRIDDDGQVAFFTKRIDGTQDVVTSVLSVSNEKFRIDIQSPFAAHSEYNQLPAPNLQETLKEALLERSIGIQAMQGFYGDTIWHTTQQTAHVIGKPDRSYKLDEYTRFTSMAEVITEFVLGLRFRKINGQRFLSALTEERYGFTTANTLVLLDGIPLLDHESIYTYNPLMVEQIDIYQGKYVFGKQLFDGIVYFKTYENDYKGVKLDSSSQLFTYKGTEPVTHFYMPDYSNQANRISRLPDMRHTLLWKPNIETKAQNRIDIPFYTSDLKGEFIVTVEGLSHNGATIHSTTSFRVE